jgi:hypothetical protein
MGPWTLILFDDATLAAEIEGVLQESWPRLAQSLRRADCGAAYDGLRRGGGLDIGQCSLVVASVSLPRDGETKLSQEDMTRGFDLMRQARSLGLKAPVIFVAATASKDLYAGFCEMMPSGFVRLGPDWDSCLAFELMRLLDTRTPQRPKNFNLDIIVGKDVQWHLVGQGMEDGGEIEVSKRPLAEAKSSSESIPLMIGQPVLWTRELSKIRNNLHSAFFSDNMLFYGKVITAIERFGGTENTRVRFVLGDDSSPLVWEALQAPLLENDYWMLRAPVFRRYQRTGTTYPLFKDRETRNVPINCLVVEASGMGGHVGGKWDTDLENLDGVADEAKTVEGILRREKEDNGTIQRLEVFRADDHADPVEALEKLLESGVWHLVHFAGHALRMQDTGGLVLKATDKGVMSATHFANLVENKVRFLYLSSCRSADAFFVMKLVERRVPAVLGFRWPVGDQGAQDFARHYYQILFGDPVSRRFIEYAFLKARKKLFERDEGDPTWAAPVLVMQLERPEEDLVEHAPAQVRPAATAAAAAGWKH